MNSIGIMQGRLSPSSDGRLQFFPKDWVAEFALAKELGFNHLQWFLDRDLPNFDPINDLWSQTDELKKIDQGRAILPISSIDCGTYGLFGPEAKITLRDFPKLFPAASGRLSTKVISLALLEKNAPKSETEKREAGQTITTLADLAAPFGLRLALETEMPVQELISFIGSLNRPNVGVGFDIGNNTSYGFDCPADIRRLGSRIIEVHCKDRKVGGSQSVLLGTGDGAFADCFAALKEIGYSGAYTLQAWRGQDYLNDAKTQLAFVKKTL
jgi:hexulose-6-phosphate isomerase